MSTSIAISAAANANAASAQAAATAAKKAACHALMPTYADGTATVQARQQYADCVQLLYPQHGSGEVAAVKGLILLSFAAAAVAVWYLQRDGEPWASSLVVGPLVGLTVGLYGFLLLALFAFLVSA